VNQRYKFMILLGVILMIAAAYYFLSTDRSSDMVLVGTVDSNQVVVSSRVMGRIEKLPVDEGTQLKVGDVIAILDTQELEAQKRAAAATVNSLRSQVSASQATAAVTVGSTSSDVQNAQAKVQATQAQLQQAQADLERVTLDAKRTISLADQGVASQQDRDRATATVKAQQALVQSLKDQIQAANADVKAAQARLHQQHAARSTVASTEAQAQNAQAQLAEADTRLGYTRIVAPVAGTVSVRATREGEVVQPGEPIVTIVDLSDTWVRVAIAETYADHIHIGDVLKVRVPSGNIINGKVIFKAVEGDFATQRDVSRIKRDIKTVALKVAVDNSQGALVPGMTADVLVPQAKLTAHEVAQGDGPGGK
jgi:HlyD family secretion protein